MISLLRLLFTVGFPSSSWQRVRWFFLNLIFGSLVRKRRFPAAHLDSGDNPWGEMRPHFHYVSEYYAPRNILRSPLIQRTMYVANAPRQPFSDTAIQSSVEKTATCWSASFNEKEGNIHNWLTSCGSILQRAEALIPGFADAMRSAPFVEFGPGLSGAAQV